MGLFHRSKAGVETPLEIEGLGDESPALAPLAKNDDAPAPPPKPPVPVAESPEFLRLKADFEQSQAKIRDMETQAKADAAEKVASRVAAIKADGKTFAAGLVTSKHLMPAGAQALADVHAFAHLAAAGLPTEGLDPVASVKGLAAGLVPHNLTAEAITDAAADSAGVFRVDNGAAGAADQPDEARINHLLDRHPSGATALAARSKTK